MGAAAIHLPVARSPVARDPEPAALVTALRGRIPQMGLLRPRRSRPATPSPTSSLNPEEEPQERAYVVEKAGLHYAVIYEGLNPITGGERWLMATLWRSGRGSDARLPARSAEGPRAEGRFQHDPGRLPPRPLATGSGGGALADDLRPVRQIGRALPAPPLGHVQLRQVHPEQLTSPYRRLAVDGGRAGEPLAAKTILNLHQLVRAALQSAVTTGLLPDNPAAAVLPPDPRKRPSARRGAASWTARG